MNESLVGREGDVLQDEGVLAKVLGKRLESPACIYIVSISYCGGTK